MVRVTFRADVVVNAREGVSTESVQALEETGVKRGREIIRDYTLLAVPDHLVGVLSEHLDELLNDEGTDLKGNEFIYGALSPFAEVTFIDIDSHYEDDGEEEGDDEEDGEDD